MLKIKCAIRLKRKDIKLNFSNFHTSATFFLQNVKNAVLRVFGKTASVELTVN